MKIVATSDLHGSLPEVEPCDLFLIGGDVCPVNDDHAVWRQRHWLRNDFASHLEKIETNEIVWIGGNHDFGCEAPGFYRVAQEISDAIRKKGGPYVAYLENELHTTQGGLKIYGSPYVPNLRNWAFYYEDAQFDQLAVRLREVGKFDIALFHGPPHGILDAVGVSASAHPHVGAPYIEDAFKDCHVEKVIFGHIHEGYGKTTRTYPVRDGDDMKWNDVWYHNVAHMDWDYNPVNPPHVIEI